MPHGPRARPISRAEPLAESAPVVCLGDSITRGRAGANWVDQVQRRFPERRIVNAGVNGNLTWNLLQRLDAVVELAPSVVVVLVGTNDVLARESEASAARYRRHQNLPERAVSLEWFAECLGELIDRLGERAEARVVGAEIPPLGEDLASEQNVRVAAYNTAVHEVCARRGVEVLPVNARLAVVLADRGRPPRPFRHSDRFAAVSIMRHWLLRHSWDEIARSRGLTVLTDHVHLSDRGGAVLRDLVVGTLDRRGDRPG